MRFPFSLLLLLLACALALGDGTQRLLTTRADQGIHPNWRRPPARALYRTTGLAGQLPTAPNLLNLDHYERLEAWLPSPLSSQLELRFTARLPVDGTITARLGRRDRNGSQGLALVLDLTRAGRSGLTRYADRWQGPLEGCEAGPARLQPERWLEVRIRSDRTHTEALIDGQRLTRCPHRVEPDLLGLTSGLRRVQLDDVTLEAGGRTVLRDHFTHPLGTRRVGALLLLASIALLGGLTALELRLLSATRLPRPSAWRHTVLTCTPLLSLPWVMRLELAPHLEALRLGLTHPTSLVFAGVVGGTALLKLCLLLGRPGIGSPGPIEAEASPASPRVRPAPGAILPALLILQTGLAWLLADAPGRLPFAAAWALTSLLWIAWLARRSTLPASLVLRLELFLTGLLALMALGRAYWQLSSVTGWAGLIEGRQGAWMPFALAGFALQLIVRMRVLFVNADAIRLAFPISLLFWLALGLTAEAFARHTYLDRSFWAQDLNKVLIELRGMASGQFPHSPEGKLMPRAFAPREDPSRLRIVAMGGSTTAGFVVTRTDLLYPARLERHLQDQLGPRGVEVINQGAQGWTTLHILKYLERVMPTLAPDLLLLYVGHNDLLTRSTLPHREVWALQARGETSATAILSRLNRIRLFGLYRQALLLMRDGVGESAVPVEHARENLRAIIAAMRRRSGRVLLVSEALNPDPLPLRPYFTMMQEVAEETGAGWLDAAASMWSRPEAGLFLDDCHLTEAGHQVLARILYDHLRRSSGLLEPAGPPARPEPLADSIPAPAPASIPLPPDPP